jgi:hypothetical protein
MKYSSYYSAVLLSSEIFMYFRGSKDSYNRWEKEVTDLLMIKKKNSKLIAEWNENSKSSIEAAILKEEVGLPKYSAGSQ